MKIKKLLMKMAEYEHGHMHLHWDISDRLASFIAKSNMVVCVYECWTKGSFVFCNYALGSEIQTISIPISIWDTKDIQEARKAFWEYREELDRGKKIMELNRAKNMKESESCQT